MNANVVFPKAVLEFTIFACTALPRLIAAYRELTKAATRESNTSVGWLAFSLMAIRSTTT